MFDGSLASISGFKRGDAIRNVAGKRNVFVAASLRYREIRIAGKHGLHFDEVHAFFDERVNVIPRLLAIVDDKRRLKRRRIAIEVRPSKKDARPDSLSFVDLLA